jgi:hypothetical protein
MSREREKAKGYWSLGCQPVTRKFLSADPPSSVPDTVEVTNGHSAACWEDKLLPRLRVQRAGCDGVVSDLK